MKIYLLLLNVVGLPRVLEPSYFSCSTNDGLGYNSNEDKTDELTSSINLMREVSSSGSVSDWIEPSMHICNSKLIQSYGANRVFDAFHLLQTEPSIQVPYWSAFRIALKLISGYMDIRKSCLMSYLNLIVTVVK